MRPRFRSAVMAAAMAAAVFVLWNAGDGAIARREDRGVKDFVVYWTGAHLLIEGQNPYHAAVFEPRIKEVYRQPDHPYANSPWATVLLLPVLIWDLRLALLIALLLNLVLYAAVCRLSWNLFSTGPLPSKAGQWISGLLPLALADLLRCGQWGLWAAAGAAGCLWALQNRRDAWAGFFLLLTAVKPHLFLPLYAALTVWTFRTGRWRPFLTASLGLILSASAANAMVPGIFSSWTAALRLLPRFENASLSGAFPGAAPLLVFVVCAGTVLMSFRHAPVWKNDFPFLICLGLAAAPYAWVHDYTVLMIPQIALVAAAVRAQPKTRPKIFALLGVFHLATSALSGVLKNQADFFWYGALYFLVWLIARSRLQPLSAR